MDDMTTEALVDGPEDVALWLTSVKSDPVAFVQGAFRWNEGELKGSSGPEPWQRWLLEQIRDGLMRPGEAIRLAVASGHGIGKSAVCSWICLWAMATAPDTRGIVTASSEAMLYSRFRAELRIWFRRFRAASFFTMGATSLVSADPAYEQSWRCDLLAWNSNRPEAFAGLHNKGRRILVIFDEASAIEPPIWETVEAIASDADAEVIWLACGNPLHATGRFRDCWDRFQGRWITKHVSSLDVSFTNKGEFERWGRDYGTDSDFYRTRVLGEWPRVGSTAFISPEAVDAAMSRELDPSHHDPLVIGVDVARFGDDCSVIFPRKGRDCRSIAPQVFRGLPLDQLEDRVVAFCNAHPVQQIFVDGTGVGGGLVDHLIRRGYNVVDVQFAGRATEQIDGCQYANQRAHIWGQLRHHLRYLCLPNLPELKEEMCSVQYDFNRAGAIQLESKEMLKRRGCKSPDLVDSLAVTYAGQISTLPALSEWVGPRGAISEYDPFSEQAILGRPLPEAQPKYYAPGWARLKSENSNEGWDRQDYADVLMSERMMRETGEG
jgi:hypothetical protein